MQAAEGYMKEADKSLSEGQAKMHLGEAMKALQAGDIQGAKMHAQVAQGMLSYYHIAKKKPTILELTSFIFYICLHL